jgi:acyl-CoA synthetase (AMP-forming)/AMP-acid ligase II
VGLPIPSTSVRIVDLDGGARDVAPGEEGELIVDGPQVMKGYLGKAEETAKVLREHEGRTWLHTGDIARLDGDGFITLVDRAKDMLIVGGFKVFSTEVEAKLQAHPAIACCAIVGVPNPERPGNDIVKLVVERAAAARDRPEQAVRDEILAFARESLSPYKVPKIVEFIDQLPLTAVGKVDKKALRKRA